MDVIPWTGTALDTANSIENGSRDQKLSRILYMGRMISFRVSIKHERSSDFQDREHFIHVVSIRWKIKSHGVPGNRMVYYSMQVRIKAG